MNITSSIDRRTSRQVGDVSLAVFAATNAARTLEGLPVLRWDPRLHRAARRRARDMAVSGTLSHAGWDDAIEDAGYPGERLGENLGFGQRTAAEIVAAWLDSPGHRRNMLGDFRDIGISWARDTDGRVYWVMALGDR